MRCVVQRVTEASVTVGGEITGAIGRGMVALIGVEKGDTDADVEYMARKVSGLRIFDDENGVMNRSLMDAGGEILAVSQFTLLGDARGGRRPSYIRAESPERADEMYLRLMDKWRDMGVRVEHGKFRAEMQVKLINDGPVTILLDSHKAF